MGRYGHDAKLLQRPAELGRLLSSCELLRDRPGRRGVVLEDRVAVVVELQREAVVPEHLAQEEEVAVGVLVLAEEGGNDFAGGVVDGAEDGGWGLVWAEPVVEAAVYLQEHSFLGPAIAAAAVSGWPAALLGSLSRLTAEALYACPAEGYALVAEEQLLEVAVVAGGVAARAQLGH